MVYSINRFKEDWRYLQENFLYPLYRQLRKSVKILISVVLGALLLAGLYMLLGDVVMPTLNERITDMFNYAG